MTDFLCDMALRNTFQQCHLLDCAPISMFPMLSYQARRMLSQKYMHSRAVLYKNESGQE
jgi:hypothetical protein